MQIWFEGTKTPPPSSIIGQFSNRKWQNLSTTHAEGVRWHFDERRPAVLSQRGGFQQARAHPKNTKPQRHHHLTPPPSSIIGSRRAKIRPRYWSPPMAKRKYTSRIFRWTIHHERQQIQMMAARLSPMKHGNHYLSEGREH